MRLNPKIINVMYKSFSFSDPAFLAQDLSIPIAQADISSQDNPTDACSLTMDALIFTEDVSGPPLTRVVTTGAALFTDPALTIPFSGLGGFHKIQVLGSNISVSAEVSAGGIVGGVVSICP